MVGYIVCVIMFPLVMLGDQKYFMLFMIIIIIIIIIITAFVESQGVRRCIGA